MFLALVSLLSSLVAVGSLIYHDQSCLFFFFFKQKTAYEIGTGDWSSDVCSSDLHRQARRRSPVTSSSADHVRPRDQSEDSATRRPLAELTASLNAAIIPLRPVAEERTLPTEEVRKTYRKLDPQRYDDR